MHLDDISEAIRRNFNKKDPQRIRDLVFIGIAISAGFTELEIEDYLHLHDCHWRYIAFKEILVEGKQQAIEDHRRRENLESPLLTHELALYRKYILITNTLSISSTLHIFLGPGRSGS